MLGDKLGGRKKDINDHISVDVFFYLCMGWIPSYERIGNLAPILLLIARLVQGFSAGGEYSGAMTFIAESSPDKKKKVFFKRFRSGDISWIYWWISHSNNILVTYLVQTKMLDWGWRIPFLLLLHMGLIGLYLRKQFRRITPVFEAMSEGKHKEKMKKG